MKVALIPHKKIGQPMQTQSRIVPSVFHKLNIVKGAIVAGQTRGHAATLARAL